MSVSNSDNAANSAIIRSGSRCQLIQRDELAVGIRWVNIFGTVSAQIFE